MSQAAYLRDMMEDPAPDMASASMSDVASFYAQQNLLITGGTGFLGKLLIERILRSCPKVNTLFLLVRAKKGKNPNERFGELFDDAIFDRMKRERRGFASKVVLIEGDVGQVGLGLSPEHRELLRSTNIVIHGAATVRFDEKLRIATAINVRGTLELLLLAKEMKDLKAFVHISTAYSYCVFNVIEEKFYPPPIDSDKLLSLVEILDDASLDHLTPVLLGKWPNTYAFTKAVAEDSIRRNCKSLPLCIVRPSMVISTFKEPISGWINNVYGPTGAVAAVGIGLLRTLHADVSLVADVIPADYVVNNVVVAAWSTAKAQSRHIDSVDRSTVGKVKEPTIYNVVSSSQRPITWDQLLKSGEKHVFSVASVRFLWYIWFRPHKNRWVHNLCVIFYHLIPAAIIDSLLWLTGREPMLWTAYKKIHKFSSVIEFFTMQEWQFHDNNVQQLCESLSPTDRSEFDLDIGKLDWEEFNRHYVRGVRLYILKDPYETLPQAQAKYIKLMIAHYTLITVLCAILVWLLWLVVRFIGLW